MASQARTRTGLPEGREPARNPGDLMNQRSFSGSNGKRTWRGKFADAFRGMKLGVRGHSSFFVHFFFAALVAITATALRCGWTSWSILLLCMALVLVAEMFNSAIETLVRGLDEKSRARCQNALDVAAGAVLLASMFAAVVGCIVFVHRLGELLGWNWSLSG
jgi:diacylglycerol kinase